MPQTPLAMGDVVVGFELEPSLVGDVMSRRIAGRPLPYRHDRDRHYR